MFLRLFATAMIVSLASVGCVTTGPNGDGDGDGDGDMNTNGPDPVETKTIEVGFTDLDDSSYMTVNDGDTMPLFTALQGGSHVFVTIRVTGFPIDAENSATLLINERIRVVSSDVLIHDFIQQVDFTAVDDETLEAPSRFMFLSAIATDIDNAVVQIEITATDPADDTATVSLQQTMLLELQ